MSVIGQDGVKVRAALTRGELDTLVVLTPGLGLNHRSSLPNSLAYNIPQLIGASYATLDRDVELEEYRSFAVPGTTLMSHVRNMATLLTRLREETGADEVHVMGHSIGGYEAVMLAALVADVTSVVLLDASDPRTPGLGSAGNWEPLSDDDDRYISTWGMGMILAGSYKRSIEAFRTADYTPWTTPTLIVSAGKGSGDLQANLWRDALGQWSQVKTIAEADHNFLSRSVVEELTEVICRWVLGGHVAR